MNAFPFNSSDFQNRDGSADALPSPSPSDNSTSPTPSTMSSGPAKLRGESAGGPSGKGVGPQLTQYDRRVLEFIGEMYGVRYTHLRVLNRASQQQVASDTAVRHRVDRLETLGLVTRRAVLGATWVTLTRRGAAAVAQTWVPWDVPATRVEHCDAINNVRLWYQASSGRILTTGDWVSERRLYRERAKVGEKWHVPDAELRLPGATGVTAIEVELHLKSPRTRYLDEVFNNLNPSVRVVVYFCPPPLLESIRASVKWAARASVRQPMPTVEVVPLPAFSVEMFAATEASS